VNLSRAQITCDRVGRSMSRPELGSSSGSRKLGKVRECVAEIVSLHTYAPSMAPADETALCCTRFRLFAKDLAWQALACRAVGGELIAISGKWHVVGCAWRGRIVSSRPSARTVEDCSCIIPSASRHMRRALAVHKRRNC
jgi:hypothetical protein